MAGQVAGVSVPMTSPVQSENAVTGRDAKAAPGAAPLETLSPSVPRQLGQALVWLAAYIVLEWVSFIHEYKGLPITPWNPGLGVLFAHLIRSSPWHGAILFAGVLLSEVLVVDSRLDWTQMVVLATIITVGYAGAAALVRHWRLDTEMTRLKDVLLLLGAGLGGAVAVAAAITGFFLASGEIVSTEILPAALPLLVGDVIGIAVATPLLLRAARFVPALASWRSMPGVLAEFAVYFVVIAVFLALTIGAERSGGFNYFYLIFLPVVAAALRHGLDGACVGLAAAQLGLVGLMHRHGFDAGTFTEYQSLMLVLSATGLIVGVVVSERARAMAAARAAEENVKALEAEAVQAARYNLVTGMASALAHEINQPMTAARALARSAQHLISVPGGGDTARAANNLGDVIAQIDHAGAIVRRMRGFLRRGSPRLSTLDVRSVLEDAVTLARSAASERNVRIVLDVDPASPQIQADHVQIQQVVLNLIHNGLDAIREGGRGEGTIMIAARPVPATGRVEISVRDDGAGLSPEVAGRLFQPLTTSKPEGLGLGLSICASIVESHGGRIWLQDSRHGSTEFRFELPVSGGSDHTP